MKKKIACFLILAFLVQMWTGVSSASAQQTTNNTNQLKQSKTSVESGAATGSAVTGSGITPTQEPSTEVYITGIEAVSSMLQVPYGSVFDTDLITVRVYYSDGTRVITVPDAVSVVDTSHIGPQVVLVSYRGYQTSLTLQIVPAMVDGIKRKSSTENSITITWNIREEAEHYILAVSDTIDGVYQDRISLTQNEYTFTGLTRGQIFYVKIRAVSGQAVGNPSEAYPIAPKPEQVAGITSVKNVKTKIGLSWNEAKGATGYAVYYRLSTAKTYQLAGYTTECAYEVKNLKAGKDYYFTVYAYAATQDNLSDVSDEVLFGTAPSIPVITKIKGGDKRIKVYWKKGSGSTTFRLYVSTRASSGFTLKETIKDRNYKIGAVDGLKNKKKYYVKVQAVRTVSGIEMVSDSAVSSATTKKAKATNTKAKICKSKSAFKKTAAYKKYKKKKKKVSYKKSYMVPGLKTTNVAGFTATHMVPQSITFAGEYLLVSAYDYAKAQESVIYVLDKRTKKYRTTLVLPHKAHLGGIVYDGENIWLTHGKKLECFPFSSVLQAVRSGAKFTEIYDITAVCDMPETVSYVSYYRGKIWAGAYSETQRKYMYGYDILNKSDNPSLKLTNRIRMPNRTQGVTFTETGKMIISRSCQTKAGRSGFMSQFDTYKPTWDFSKKTLKKNKRKRVVKMPPMNEGIAISGTYTYVIYESTILSECEAPLDLITAFKTRKIC